MRRAIGLLIVATLALVAGCGPSTQQLGGVERKKIYYSIVSLSPSSTELLEATQRVNNRLKGRTASDNWPRGQVENIPVVASVKPDYEKIAALKPDLVAYDSDLYGAADVEKIKQLGADVFVVDATTVDGLIKECYALGTMLGGETNMSDYADKLTTAKADAASMTKHPTVAVLMPGTTGQHMIAGTDSFIADVIKSSGGVPVGPKGTQYVSLDPELIVTLNPDYIVCSGPGTALMADPRLKSLKAITQHKLLAVNPDVLLRRGSRVDILITAIHDAISK
jgi:ABC-type Fe3+-hydroxamate transport system substrate-binding protein